MSTVAPVPTSGRFLLNDAIGPFLRLFDGTFSLDDVRQSVITVRVDGPDQFVLDDSSSMAKISRDPADLVAQTIGANHQYPDGFLLFCGTMFAPIKDRDGKGQGFTYRDHRHTAIGRAGQPGEALR